MYVCIYVYVCGYVYLCVYMYVCICEYLYMYMDVCMYNRDREIKVEKGLGDKNVSKREGEMQISVNGQIYGILEKRCFYKNVCNECRLIKYLKGLQYRLDDKNLWQPWCQTWTWFPEHKRQRNNQVQVSSDLSNYALSHAYTEISTHTDGDN